MTDRKRKITSKNVVVPGVKAARKSAAKAKQELKEEKEKLKEDKAKARRAREFNKIMRSRRGQQNK